MPHQTDELALELTLKPVFAAVEITDAKKYLRVDTATEDPQIKRMVAAATTLGEKFMARRLIFQNWRLHLDAFPWDDGPILLPYSPVDSIVNFDYTDVNGVAATLTLTTDYVLDKIRAPGRVHPAFDQVWPDAREIPNAVAIEFKVGYGTDSTTVPEDIRQGILLTVADMYDNRPAAPEGGASPTISVPIPRMVMAAQLLWQEYRVQQFH